MSADKKQALARLHLETAVELIGLEMVKEWINQGITVHEENSQAPPEQKKETRGRKPGAAPADIRCAWIKPDGDQCKQARITGSTHCKIHVGKATMIAIAVGESPPL